MKLPDRHGHWPLGSAAGVVPGAALVAKRRGRLGEPRNLTGLLPAVALLAHQTEEWVLPGGFMPWFNREVMDAGEDEFPITRRTGFVINVGLGWSIALVAWAPSPARPALAAAQLTIHLGNAALHLSQLARTRSYNPGSATSALLFVPIGVLGLRALAREDPRETSAGAVVGAVSAVALIVTMRRKVARRRGTRFG